MGYKMNGNPAKLGTIKGTSGHASAVKLAQEQASPNKGWWSDFWGSGGKVKSKKAMEEFRKGTYEAKDPKDGKMKTWKIGEGPGEESSKGSDVIKEVTEQAREEHGDLPWDKDYDWKKDAHSDLLEEEESSNNKKSKKGGKGKGFWNWQGFEKEFSDMQNVMAGRPLGWTGEGEGKNRPEWAQKFEDRINKRLKNVGSRIWSPDKKNNKIKTTPSYQNMSLFGGNKFLGGKFEVGSSNPGYGYSDYDPVTGTSKKYESYKKYLDEKYPFSKMENE